MVDRITDTTDITDTSKPEWLSWYQVGFEDGVDRAGDPKYHCTSNQWQDYMAGRRDGHNSHHYCEKRGD